MNLSEAKLRISRLREQAEYHERLYRIHNAPEITDEQYDDIIRELRLLEERFPSLQTPDSPTRRLGADHDDSFESVAHLSPMLSLDNVFDTVELAEFDKRLAKLLGEGGKLRYCVEPKIDGAGISAVYESGRLVRLLTRGDGEAGDDITRNLPVFKNIPRELSGDGVPELLEIRGEAYMTRSEFERIKSELRAESLQKAMAKKSKKSGDGLEQLDFGVPEGASALTAEEIADIERKLPANPRNLASGTLKLLDKNILETRELMAAFYSVGKSLGFSIQRQSELPGRLRSLGLPSVPWSAVADGAQGAFEKISELEGIRSDFPFNTDGAVVKLDDCSLYKTAGMTSRAPRWAVAWKYRAERAQTKVKSISMQVGRTGVVTPVAELEPVFISGSTVSRATLHNAGYIAQKDIRQADTVVIEKAGEIIPAVLGVVLEKRPADSVPFEFPQACPECGSPLKRFGEKMLYRCPNLSCPPQVRGRIEHFASRDCMDIRGLGGAVVDKLVENLGVKDPSDLYLLTRERLLTLEKFKDKSADNLIVSIAESKKRDLWRLIFGLGILEIGEQFAKDLARKFKSLDNLMDASIDEIKTIDGLGGKFKKLKSGELSEPVRALSVRAFFDDPHNRALVERLRSCGLNFVELESRGSSDTPFSGKTFALTGTLASMDRNRAKTLIENFGGKTASSVTKHTDFLVSAGDSSGNKSKRASELGIKVLTEAEFLSMLNEAGASLGDLLASSALISNSASTSKSRNLDGDSNSGTSGVKSEIFSGSNAEATHSESEASEGTPENTSRLLSSGLRKKKSDRSGGKGESSQLELFN